VTSDGAKVVKRRGAIQRLMMRAGQVLRRVLAAPFDETTNRRLLDRLEIGASSLIVLGIVVLGPFVLAGAVLSLRVGPWTLVNIVAACLVLDFAIKAARIVATRRAIDVRRAMVSILVASTIICLEHMKDGMGDSMRRLYEGANEITGQTYQMQLGRFDQQTSKAHSLQKQLSIDALNRRHVADSLASSATVTTHRNTQTVMQAGRVAPPSATEGESGLDRLIPPAPKEIDIPHWMVLVDWAGPFLVSFLALVVLLSFERATRLRSRGRGPDV
jgi:hypothetical protein